MDGHEYTFYASDSFRDLVNEAIQEAYEDEVIEHEQALREFEWEYDSTKRAVNETAQECKFLKRQVT